MRDFLYHLFIPHNKNNHRSKILHTQSLLILFLFLFSFGLSLLSLKTTRPDILGISYSVSENELLVLTNKMRQEKNLLPLVQNQKLQLAAQKKAFHMFENNYWAHFSPNGETPWDFIKGENYSYLYAGENLAKGFTNSEDAVDAWMNSPTHKNNILSDKFQEIGFAVVKGKLMGEETVLIVQMFGSETIPQFTANKSSNILANNSQEVAVNDLSKKVQVSSNFANSVFTKPAIDISIPSKTIPFIILSLLLMALFIDLIVVDRKKIPRVVGHNLDHIMMISIFIIFMIFMKTGGTL